MAANALKGSGGGGGGGVASAEAGFEGTPVDPTQAQMAKAQKAAMGGEGSDQKLEAINEILNS